MDECVQNLMTIAKLKGLGLSILVNDGSHAPKGDVTKAESQRLT